MTLIVLTGLLNFKPNSQHYIFSFDEKTNFIRCLPSIYSLPCVCGQFYHNNPKYWDRQAGANIVDPDHMLQNQGPRCLSLIQPYFWLFQIFNKYGK